MRMRFIVISDVHRRERVIDWTNEWVETEGAEGVIVLGDITQFGPPEWAGEFLSALRGKVYALPGNCDPPLTLSFIERSSTSLDRRRLEIGGYEVVGIGGSNPTIFDTPNELSEEEIDSLLRPLMVRGAIIASHAPPYGFNDVPPSGGHTGSTALRRIVDDFRPKLVLSGHIHEARGMMERDGIKYMNPGAAKDGFGGVLELGDEVEVRLLEPVQ